MNRLLSSLFAMLLCAPVVASAEEGMWLFNDFPAERVEKAYGFKPTQQWLDKVRLGSARLAGGCSASFVSPEGLLMTNHHCIRSCIQDLSTAKNDHLEKGFFAKTREEERRCPKVEVNQLVKITDVTGRVQKAVSGKEGAEFSQALKAETASIEGECAKDAKVRCDLVTLFHGGKYHLYEYRRFQDVRLAFAPEFPMAAFGGDPDNFNFPRYGIDMAFMRVYEDDAAAKTPDYLRWAKTSAKPGELVFVSGHPGGTERVQTVEQLAFQRDVALPYFLVMLAELRGIFLQYQDGNPERFRLTRARLRSVENSLKALRGRHQYLADEAFFEKKRQEDQALRQKVEADPKLKEKFGAAWKEIDAATDVHRKVFTDYRLLEAGDAFNSELFGLARKLVRAAEEKQKPDTERLREYTTAQLPALEQQLFRATPIPKSVEELTLSFSLRRLRETLGVDHPTVQKVLGREAPEVLAKRLVNQSKLSDPKVRRKLYEGGKAAIDASKDPMIVLARQVDADARAVRKKYEEQVDAPLKKAGEQLNKAHVAVYGTSGYPDATFTLRLSFGKVDELTYAKGLYDRHTGRFPFDVAPTWLKAKGKVDPMMPINMSTTNDIIGGNSGSPLVNRDAEIVGLIFDGNLPSLAGRYGYDPVANRAVAVHGEGMVGALRKVYRAERIAKELEAARDPASAE